jgi:hypothetical protein
MMSVDKVAMQVLKAKLKAEKAQEAVLKAMQDWNEKKRIQEEKDEEKAHLDARKTEEKAMKNRAKALKDQKKQENKEAAEKKKQEARARKEQQALDRAKKSEARALQKRLKFERMMRVGFWLMEKYPGGFTADQAGSLFIKEYGLIAPFTGKSIEDPVAVCAGVRSLISEMSPSSCQQWYKYGSKRSDGEVAPWHFVNKKLAIMNNELEWAKTLVGTGRAGNRGLWTFEPVLRRDTWDDSLYGPLPNEEQLDAGRAGRGIGARNHD